MSAEPWGGLLGRGWVLRPRSLTRQILVERPAASGGDAGVLVWMLDEDGEAAPLPLELDTDEARALAHALLAAAVPGSA